MAAKQVGVSLTNREWNLVRLALEMNPDQRIHNHIANNYTTRPGREDEQSLIRFPKSQLDAVQRAMDAAGINYPYRVNEVF